MIRFDIKIYHDSSEGFLDKDTLVTDFSLGTIFPVLLAWYMWEWYLLTKGGSSNWIFNSWTYKWLISVHMYVCTSQSFSICIWMNNFEQLVFVRPMKVVEKLLLCLVLYFNKIDQWKLKKVTEKYMIYTAKYLGFKAHYIGFSEHFHFHEGLFLLALSEVKKQLWIISNESLDIV